MIDTSTLIRTARRKSGVLVYIFPCQMCGKEMPLQAARWKTHSGYCVKCVKRRNTKPYETLYNRLKTTAHKEGRELTLTYEEFEFLTQIGVCNYCGDKIEWKQWYPGPYNLDRKDSKEGYTFDNVVVCCRRCNFQKNNFYSHEEFHVIQEVLKVLRGTCPLTKQALQEFVYGSYVSS